MINFFITFIAAQNVDSPQGTSGGVISEVIGKSFGVVISPVGIVVDLSEAKKVVFNIEVSGQSDVSQSFTELMKW